MTNSLIKTTTIEAVVGVETTPATPFRPATPPRTVMETRTVCMFRYNGPGHYVFSTDPQTNQVTGHFVPDNLGSSGGLQGTFSCQPELVPVTYPGTPAQPYVPGHSVTTTTNRTSFNLGWNAGGRSAAVFLKDGFVEFKVRSGVVGVICGLNCYDGVNSGYNGNTTDFAFYCARGQARIIQNGVLGTGLGPYTDATVFHIERVDDTVSFQMDGTEVFSIASGAPTDAAWLEAALYSAGDEVFDPVLQRIGADDLTTQTATLDITLEPLEMFASDGMYAELAGDLPSLIFDSSTGALVPSYAVGDFSLPPFFFYGDSLTGEIGTLDGFLQPLEMLAADHPYGELRGTLPELLADLSAYEGNLNASMLARGALSTAMAPLSLLFVTMASSGTLTAAGMADIVIPAEMNSQATLDTSMSTSAILEAVMASLATSGTLIGVPESDSETWVVNLGTNGTTNYTNYGFNSFALVGRRYFGAGPDGIYQLDGDTDAGTAIRAKVALGKLDFASAVMKSIGHAYVGMSAAGNLFMKVTVPPVRDGEPAREYIYKTRSYSGSLQQQRIDFGKGLKANYVEVELYNENGADFELDTVEFHVADLKRRI